MITAMIVINKNKYKNKYVAVIGLGKSGLSTIQALRDSDIDVIAWDDSESKCSQLRNDSYFFKDIIINPDDWQWGQIAKLVVSPGIPKNHPIINTAHKYNCPISSDIELLIESCPDATYIGVTGTNGKSTTTALIHHILGKLEIKAQIGGNIGNPVLEFAMNDGRDVYVLELSSFQLDLLQKPYFNIAILTNISPDHLDRHGDMESYVNAKKNIFNNQTKNDVAIIGVDCEISANIYKEMSVVKRQKLLPISAKKILDYGVSVVDNILYINMEKSQTLTLGALPNLRGNHNAENIAAAVAAICASDEYIDYNKLLEAIKDFAGLKHRMQNVAIDNNILFINDSKATNAEATQKALACFDKNIYWIAGGIAKEGGINILKDQLNKVIYSFFYGSAKNDFATTAEGKTKYSLYEDIEKAFDAAYEMAKNSKEESVILLSPSCASYDQFKNFEERGDIFCQLVMNKIR
jgi:UDP-N-acetylmuramoylalanine--D-glutamate ligase